MKASWKYQVVSIQTWNNNKEGVISKHKSYEEAEKHLNRKIQNQQNELSRLYPNLYRIEKL